MSQFLHFDIAYDSYAMWLYIHFSLADFDDEFDVQNSQLLVDPFKELWKKFLGTLSYFCQILGGLIILSFIRYETQGHAAHFRTALNQLTSWIGLIVS